MKEIVISPKSVRRELWMGLACFVAACLVNVYAIVRFDRPWEELYTQIGFVIVIALALYVIAALVRLLAVAIMWIVKRLIRK